MFNLQVRGKPLVPAIVFGSLALLVVLVAARLLSDDSRTSPDVIAPSMTTEPFTETSVDGVQHDERILEITAFVAEQRELEFLFSPEIELLDEEAFEVALVSHLARTFDLEAVAESTEIFTALGLIPIGVEVDEAILEFLRVRTLGFFDAEIGLIRIRGAQLTAMTELVLVHELTHVLDDQHFSVDSSRFSESDDESELAFQALVEGSANLIESRWLDTFTDADFAELATQQASLPVAPTLPSAVATALTFAHTSGESFARALVAEGGNELLNEAYLRPPRTSEQIIELQLPGSEEVVSELAPLAVDATVVSSGTLGALTLRLLLETSLDYGEAFNLSLQWGGDSYVVWHSRSATCVTVDFAAESSQSQVLLEDALERVAVNRAGTASVEAIEGATRFTGCG